MTPNRSFAREVAAACRHSKRVWAAQLAANAALLAAFYGWLRIPDRAGWQVASTALLGLVLVIAALWLHAATLAYFCAWHGDPRASFAGAWRATLPRLASFALWSAVLAALLWAVAQAWQYNPQLAGWGRHLLPEPLRSRISPRTVAAIGEWKFWVLFWIIVPGLLLPLGAQASAHGFRGFARRQGLRALKSWRYWLAAAVLALIGVWLAVWIAEHASRTGSLAAQTVSMVLRFAAAYLLSLTSWVILCAVLGWFSASPGPLETVAVREPAGALPPDRSARAGADLDQL